MPETLTELMKNETYKPEPFDLRRPPHLLANDLLRRIELRNGVQFGKESHADVEMLIRQLMEANIEQPNG